MKNKKLILIGDGDAIHTRILSELITDMGLEQNIIYKGDECFS